MDIPQGFLALIPYTPANAAYVMQRETRTVSTNIGTKQDLLPPVPAGMERIVPTPPTVRRATESLAGIIGHLTVGWDGSNCPALMVQRTSLATLHDSLNVTAPPVNAGGLVDNSLIGVEGDIFGGIFNDSSIEAEVTIDTWYYDAPIAS